MRRGEVVIVDLRPHDPNAKVRPALVVQCDRDNARMSNTIIVAITSVLRRSAEPTQLLIDAGHPDWQASGLRLASVMNCSTVYTVQVSTITHRIGQLTPATMAEIDRCLKSALALA